MTIPDSGGTTVAAMRAKDEQDQLGLNGSLYFFSCFYKNEHRSTTRESREAEGRAKQDPYEAIGPPLSPPRRPRRSSLHVAPAIAAVAVSHLCRAWLTVHASGPPVVQIPTKEVGGARSVPRSPDSGRQAQGGRWAAGGVVWSFPVGGRCLTPTGGVRATGAATMVVVARVRMCPGSDGRPAGVISQVADPVTTMQLPPTPTGGGR